MSLLTGSANCIKYVLFAFNLVFMLTGIILIAVGVGVAAVYTEYEVFLINKFFSIPTFLIVIGSFVIIIAFFGCWGALKENYCLVLTFSVLLGIIFILELAAGISGYVLRDDAEQYLEASLLGSIGDYKTNLPNEETIMWDYVQNHFDCCGVNKFEDWSKISPNGDLPISCCRIPNGIIGNLTCNSDLHNPYRRPNGCLVAFSGYIKDHAVSLGTAGVVIACIQFFGVLFACYIAREIKIRNGITGFM